MNSGILVNFDVNSILLNSTLDKIKGVIKSQNVRDFELSGRIKDAGMLEEKIARVKTEQDAKTIKYEELGFRIVLKDYLDFTLMRDYFVSIADFVKDYVSEPRRDGLILGINREICYHAFHIYTSRFVEKPVEVQILTASWNNKNLVLTQRFGSYWKTKEFKERRVFLGDLR